MIYSDDRLKKLQETEIEIAKEIIRICNNNDISYFSVGGTTLGAVRHNGFIPWDDDMDLGMQREDYNRFLQIASKQLSEDFVLQHYSVEPKTPTYHAKVMKRDTLFVESYAEKIDIPHGVFVDVMPFDNIPTDERELKKYRHTVKKYHQLFIAKSVWKTSLTKGKRKYLFTIIRSVLHVLMKPVPKEYLYKQLERELQKYNETETGKMSSRGLRAFECNKTDVFPTKPHAFDTLMLQIPKNEDVILKQQYGDYMKLPPIHQRTGHEPKRLEI